MIRALPYALTLGVGIAGAWFVLDLKASNAALSRDLMASKAELVQQVAIAEQAAIARDVARAEAERQRTKADEYEAVKAALRNGGFDAELPDDFRRLLAGILWTGRGDANSPGRP